MWRSAAGQPVQPLLKGAGLLVEELGTFDDGPQGGLGRLHRVVQAGGIGPQPGADGDAALEGLGLAADLPA